MKRIQLLMLTPVLLFLSKGYGQDYVPFNSEYAKWNEATYVIGLGFEGWSNQIIELNGDTLIGDTLYKKVFHSTEDIYIGALREDSLKRIYFRPHDTEGLLQDDYSLWFPSFNEDYLLYDFDNIQVGDTLNYANYAELEENEAYSYIVMEQDSILIGGQYRKIYELESPPVLGGINHFVEGVGSLRGLLGPYENYSDQLNESILTCYEDTDTFYENESLSFYNNDWNTQIVDCKMENIINVEEYRSLDFSIHPNPSSDILNLSIPTSLQNLENLIIEIRQVDGRIIESLSLIDLSNSNQMNIQHYSSGVYVFSLINKDSEVFSERVIIDDQ